MKKNIIILLTGLLLTSLFSSFSEAQVKWTKSKNSEFWITSEIKLVKAKEIKADITIFPEEKEQIVNGFGACFNELGWTALSVLDDARRESILKDLFDPSAGLKLNICRMPIGANDYSRDYYSLNDTQGDFEMKNFNIERDKQMLIPYIKAAMKYRPDLQVWGSPWCPPSWMKTNGHYACRPTATNGLSRDKMGRENLTQFIMEEPYLKAYALYFTKYVQAYRNEGINITGVHVQNEMNSCQNFPSCIWTANDLGLFIGKYLGPALSATVPDAEIWYGTVERPSVEKVDTILQDTVTSKYIDGISFQWAGKQAIAGVHTKYPEIKLMQSETECGNGTNDWKAAEYTFSLMKHYFENGVSVYSFWNSVLDETGKSQWGWKQNAMITVNSTSKEIVYNPEFYLLKHFSFFIKPGAYKIKTEGNNSELLAFRNPDKSIVVIIGNSKDSKYDASVRIGNEILQASLEPHSFNTFIVK